MLRSPTANTMRALPDCILQLLFRRGTVVGTILPAGRKMIEVMMTRYQTLTHKPAQKILSSAVLSTVAVLVIATSCGTNFAAAQTPAAAPTAGTAGASAGTSPLPKTAPFAELTGAWTGAGQIRLEGGKTERVTCKAYYTPKDEGTAIGIALRCASTSYSIDLRSNLESANGRVTGNWEERTFNAAGNVTGRASNGNVSVAISGGGLSGSMSVSFGGSSQQVSITTSGTALKGVSISLQKS
jgi:hypothetical protein